MSKASEAMAQARAWVHPAKAFQRMYNADAPILKLVAVKSKGPMIIDGAGETPAKVVTPKGTPQPKVRPQPQAPQWRCLYDSTGWFVLPHSLKLSQSR